MSHQSTTRPTPVPVITGRRSSRQSAAHCWGGYQPYAAWVTNAMLRTGRPAFAVALNHPEADQVFPVIVGGGSIDWGISLMDEAYTPETGRGWWLIEGEALDLYMRWARQEPEPPQLELDFAMGMRP